MPGSDREFQRDSRSTSFRSISTAFHSSLQSIQSRVSGTCSKIEENDDSDDKSSSSSGSSNQHLSAISSRVSSFKSILSAKVTMTTSKGSRIWKRLRNAIKVKIILQRNREQHVMDTTEQESATPSDIASEGVSVAVPNKRPDDWFYQEEVKVSDAAKRRQQQLSERLTAIREAECTFRPAITERRRARVNSSFLRRQKTFENRRASLLNYQKAKQEWVLRDIVKEGQRRKVADPEGVWQRSVDWQINRLSRRISRQIDQRVDDLSHCPFEPLRDWERVRTSKMHQFHVWKQTLDHRQRTDFYKDLAHVIQSISDDAPIMESH